MATETFERITHDVEQLSPEEQVQLINLIEELSDIRAYKAAKARLASGEDELIPLDQAIAELETR